MMSLFDVALAGNTEQFEDAYGVDTFYGQVQLFNESVRSGPAAKRRIIEVGPDVIIPETRTVIESTTGQVYILADGATDWYRGRAIAVKHPALPVDDIFNLRTVEQILSNSGGSIGVYGSVSYIRRIILEESSDYLGGYELIYSAYFQPVPSGSIFYNASKYFRTRESSRTDDIGLGISEVVEIPSPLRTLSYLPETYVPATDSFTTGVSSNVSCFVEPLYLNFEHEVLGFIKPDVGDLAVTLLKTAAPAIKPNEKLGDLLILSVKSNGGTWVCHARQHHV